LLLAGSGIVAVLAWLLWQSGRLEEGLREAEAARAHAVAERILQRAPASRVAFATLPAATRAVALGDGTLQIDDVGWLQQEPSAVDADAVVADRLERATRSEFVAGDAAATRTAYDELLAAPLAVATRCQVVLAAAWHALRAGDPDRLRVLRTELDERLAALAPADLRRPDLARVVAGTLRLVASDSPPPWAAQLAPFLPPDLFASLPASTAWRDQHQTVVQRRERLVALATAWRTDRPGTEAGMRPLTPERLLWWQARDGGGHDLAAVTSAEFVAAITAAGRESALPELPLPWSFALADAANTTFVGLPGVAGIDMPVRGSPWLQPAAVGGLLLLLVIAFVGAIRLQLRAARAEVAAVRTQSEFLTTVTHELKTPLAAIRLLGEMLVDGRARGREADYYRMLAGEAGRLSMLIENVLDLGRLERGERSYELRSVAVDEVVDETVAMLAPVFEHEGGGIRRGAAAGAMVRADRSALVQALVAVLDNARKYGGAGGPIEITTRRDGDRAAIDVRDRGPGVPAAERERIFDRFVRGAAHAHGGTPGIGIGLYLARSIARRLGGDLVATDPLDGGPGVCFTFFLPMETTT